MSVLFGTLWACESVRVRRVYVSILTKRHEFAPLCWIKCPFYPEEWRTDCSAGISHFVRSFMTVPRWNLDELLQCGRVSLRCVHVQAKEKSSPCTLLYISRDAEDILYESRILTVYSHFYYEHNTVQFV